ncbi:hypothetical protein I317_07146 [Kwoniella heveanensis CBS 569]|nr:hypothetical protein I317_07146 [Kwoniella heveanensis CBS 569]
MAPLALPLDLGGVGDSIEDVADDAVGGATSVAAQATSAAAEATNKVGDIKNQADEAAGMLKMFKQIQELEKYWDQYKNLIIFIVCLIIFIYVASMIYCCYHFVHDFCRCAGCCVKCVWKSEECLRKNGFRCVRYCCRKCSNSRGRHRQDREGERKSDYHGCSNCCLKMVPRSTRLDLEKQHGDLRKGWMDSTYVGRSCGRYELPEDPVERAKWHWWGHETLNPYRYRTMAFLFPWSLNKEKRLERELAQQKRKVEYRRKMKSLARELGRDAGDLKDRIQDWKAYSKKKKPRTEDEQIMLEEAEERLEQKELDKEKSGRVSTDSESTIVADDEKGVRRRT